MGWLGLALLVVVGLAILAVSQAPDYWPAMTPHLPVPHGWPFVTTHVHRLHLGAPRLPALPRLVSAAASWLLGQR